MNTDISNNAALPSKCFLGPCAWVPGLPLRGIPE